MADDNDTDPPAAADHIDILQMELDRKLPYWLSWLARFPEKAAAIRERNREKWLKQFGQPHRKA